MLGLSTLDTSQHDSNVDHVIKPSEIAALIEREVASLSDARVIDHIRSLLVLPNVVMREWDYGKEPMSYPCWSVLEHPKTNTGIAYCESGFGPRSPWGLVFLSGPHMSIGMDAGWFAYFLEAYFESMAASDLPIWRVYKQENDFHPGVPVTPEGDWDSTWKEVYRLREADKTGRYNCWHGIVHEKE